MNGDGWEEPKVRQRFMESFAPNEDTGCWNWRGNINVYGYGVIVIRRKSVRAHRLSFALHNGRWPTLWVLHSCDNRACVNPDHLREGTHQDNMDDRSKRGRVPDLRGSRNNHAKLTERDVVEIRARRAAGDRQASIARAFSLSQGWVSDIVNRKRWTHVDDQALAEMMERER